MSKDFKKIIKFKTGQLIAIRVGQHRDGSWPYLNFEMDGVVVVAMPVNSELRKKKKKKKEIDYILRKKK